MLNAKAEKGLPRIALTLIIVFEIYNLLTNLFVISLSFFLEKPTGSLTISCVSNGS